VAERFIRTLEEQVVHGHAYAGVDHLREAVRRFVETYNRAWRLAKLGFKSPLEARAAASLPMAACRRLVSRGSRVRYMTSWSPVLCAGRHGPTPTTVMKSGNHDREARSIRAAD
jgi:hypothetical protein